MIPSVLALFHALFFMGLALGWVFHRTDSWPALIGFAVLVEVSLVGVALWAGFRLRFPMLKLLAKARDVRRAEEDHRAVDEESVDIEDWSMLESALTRIGEDLRESRESADRERVQLKVLLHSVSEAVFAVDLKERAIFANTRFKGTFGRSSDAAVRGTKLTEWVRDPWFLECFRKALRKEEASRFELQLSGEFEAQARVFQVSVNPVVFRREGRVIGAMAILHDVSELKRAEKMQSRFIVDVSHELRTPLTSIQGYRETLEESLREAGVPQASHAWKAVAVIKRNTERLMLLVQDLLDLTSIEAGRRHDPAWVPLKEITENLAQGLKPQLEAKRQSIAIRIDVERAFVDPSRLEQVLTNLLENAIKYCPEDTPIEVHWFQEGAEWVVLKVSDQGPGIPAEHLDRLFDRFYRLDRSRSRETGGSGLGLSIVKKIMESHRGELTVESKTGRGTAFICRFPVQVSG